MKRLLLILLVLVMFAGCAAPAAEGPVQPEEITTETTDETVEATEETAEQPQEETVSLGTFTAQALTGGEYDERYFADAELTVINVWATYCGPCKQEMPVLGALDRELENVQVLGIVTDVLDQQGEVDPKQVEVALELHTTLGCDYPSLILNEDLAMLGFASLTAVPATLFVDRNGNLVGQGFYGALDEAGWRDTIAQRLELVEK